MTEERESRVYRHGVAEHRRDPKCGGRRYWRGWFTIHHGGIGRWAGGQRRDLGFHAELLLWHSHRGGHGWGWKFAVSSEDCGIAASVHLGRLGSLWTDIGGCLPAWLTPKKYETRETLINWTWANGAMLARGLYWRIWRKQHEHRSADPWYLDGAINQYKILGRTRYEKVTLDSGTCYVPMPEGDYPATWGLQVFTSEHVRWPGTWWDRLRPYKRTPSYWIDVEGGIPVQSKGENSWDCGMDGIFGTGGPTLDEAIGNVRNAALRDRKKYGGPFDLARPTAVSEFPITDRT